MAETGMCLDPVDLCVAKSIAGRPKDHEFVSALIRDELVEASEILERITTDGIRWPAVYTDDRELALTRATRWLESVGTDRSPAADAGEPAADPPTEDQVNGP